MPGRTWLIAYRLSKVRRLHLQKKSRSRSRSQYVHFNCLSLFGRKKSILSRNKLTKFIQIAESPPPPPAEVKEVEPEPEPELVRVL